MIGARLTEDASLESLVAQVVDEFVERQRRGERPDPTEYAARYPHAAAVLREVLAALQVVGLSSAAGLAPGSGAPAAEGAATGTLGDFRILREVGRGLKPPDNDVAIKRVQFHQEPFASGLLRSDQRAAAAAEQVEHVFAAAGGVLDGPDRQRGGLLGQVLHVQRRNLLDGPQVGGIGRSEELVAGAFAPSVTIREPPCNLCATTPDVVCPK
jgi:hypothetical protein